MTHKLDTLSCKLGSNSRAYAVGTQRRNGFHIRRIVWGWLMARHARPMKPSRARVKGDYEKGGRAGYSTPAVHMGGPPNRLAEIYTPTALTTSRFSAR